MGLELGDGDGSGREQYHGAEYDPKGGIHSHQNGKAALEGCDVVILGDGSHTGDIL